MQPLSSTGSTTKPPALLLGIAMVFLLLRVATGIYETHYPPAPLNLIRWVPLGSELAESKKSNKPILYDFTADWCAPCKKMDREMYADKNTAEEINRMFVPVRIVDRLQEDKMNTPQVEKLKNLHQVEAFPTLVVIYPDEKRKPVVLEGYPGKTSTLHSLKEAYLAQFIANQ